MSGDFRFNTSDIYILPEHGRSYITTNNKFIFIDADYYYTEFDEQFFNYMFSHRSHRIYDYIIKYKQLTLDLKTMNDLIYTCDDANLILLDFARQINDNVHINCTLLDNNKLKSDDNRVAIIMYNKNFSYNDN